MTYLGYKNMGVGDGKVVDLEVLLSEAQFDRRTYYGKAIKRWVQWIGNCWRHSWRTLADASRTPTAS